MKNAKPQKQPFNYGKFIIEFRTSKDGDLRFLKKKLEFLDEALIECSKLRDLGYDRVMIRKTDDK